VNQPRPLDEASLLEASLAELERQRAAVLKLNQLKNDLIAVLAHDIKGPLTSIVGFAELLEEGYLTGDDATDAARTIRSNAQRLATLANDVLSLSRIEHGELEIAEDRVDLVTLIAQAIDAVGGTREILFKPELPQAVVRGDADRLRQVVDNLLRNALKYSPETEPVFVDLGRDDANFTIAVRDRGIGIPEEDLARLFRRFSRGSHARRARLAGTGLGLFIVKMIVDAHGGTIAVRSRVDEGSTFTVTLPSYEAALAHRPKHVVIIAVDKHIRLFAAYELRSRGYRVRECESVSEIGKIGEVCDSDVVILGPRDGTPAELRAVLPENVAIRLVGMDRDDGECDAVLRQPFLSADLLAAVSGEPREAFLNTSEDTSGVPTDEPLGGTVRTP
jgi:two-component sensor histidine kinase